MSSSWQQKVEQFVQEYPEFIPYLNMAPDYPFKKMHYRNVNNLFEAILHYICAVGVRYSYALKQWNIIYPLIASYNSWETICCNVATLIDNPNIQPKKRKIYFDLCQYMNENGLDNNNISVNNLRDIQKNVNGVGDGCVAFCKKYFTMDDDCLEYTDIYFKKGFMKIYGTDKLSERKKKCTEWKNKNFGRVANLFVLNIG